MNKQTNQYPYPENYAEGQPLNYSQDMRNQAAPDILQGHQISSDQYPYPFPQNQRHYSSSMGAWCSILIYGLGMFSSMASVRITLQNSWINSSESQTNAYFNLASYLDFLSIVMFIPSVIIMEKIGIKISAFISLLITTICLWMQWICDSFGAQMAFCIINYITIGLYVYSITAVPQEYIASKSQRMIALAVILQFYVFGDNIFYMVANSPRSISQNKMRVFTVIVAIISSACTLSIPIMRPNRDDKSNSQVYYDNNKYSHTQLKELLSDGSFLATTAASALYLAIIRQFSNILHEVYACCDVHVGNIIMPLFQIAGVITYALITRKKQNYIQALIGTCGSSCTLIIFWIVFTLINGGYEVVFFQIWYVIFGFLIGMSIAGVFQVQAEISFNRRQVLGFAFFHVVYELLVKIYYFYLKFNFSIDNPSSTSYLQYHFIGTMSVVLILVIVAIYSIVQPKMNRQQFDY